jgi:putative salt-induced outer membrane protein YdiY
VSRKGKKLSGIFEDKDQDDLSHCAVYARINKSTRKMKSKGSIQRIVPFVLMIALEAASMSSAQDTEPGPKWTSSGALGYTQSGGNTNASSVAMNWDLMREGVRTHMAWKAALNYGYTRYTDKDIVTTNNNFALYKIDRFLSRSKKSYLFGQLQYQGDQFQGYWAKYMADAGFGYNWFGKTGPLLKTELGYSYIGWSYVEPNKEGEYWEPTHNALFRLSLSHQVRDWLKVSEDAVSHRNLEHADNYQIESTTSATFRLTTRLGYKSAFTVRYNNQPLLVEEKDAYGAAVVDENDEPVLKSAERTDYTWTNMLVITFL